MAGRVTVPAWRWTFAATEVGFEPMGAAGSETTNTPLVCAAKENVWREES